MTKPEMVDRYFNWMCDLVCNESRTKESYHELLAYLYDKKFIYILPMDANRAGDGLDLRYRYCYDHNYNPSFIEECICDRPCSVLEMIIALAIRCEEEFMSDEDYGDRTGKWFWYMIDNLGLHNMKDNRYDKNKVEEIINKFLNRDYEPDGRGGLVTVNHPIKDMRSVEIWYQMMWYLDSVLNI